MENVIRKQENGIEYFTVKSTGESGLSQTGLAKLCGITKQAVNKLVNDLSTGKAPKRLQRWIGKDLHLSTNSRKKGGILKVLKSEFCFAVVKHYAMEGSTIAEEILDSIGAIGFDSFVQGITGWLPQPYQSSTFARQQINRILDTPCPWEKLYEKEACLKAFTWYGADFYWIFCYQWMIKEEQCKLNQINPCIRGARQFKIHQYIEPETKVRLTPYVQELCVLLDVCNSKQEFATKYAKRYGAVQTELGV